MLRHELGVIWALLLLLLFKQEKGATSRHRELGLEPADYSLARSLKGSIYLWEKERVRAIASSKKVSVCLSISLKLLRSSSLSLSPFSFAMGKNGGNRREGERERSSHSSLEPLL